MMHVRALRRVTARAPAWVPRRWKEQAAEFSYVKDYPEAVSSDDKEDAVAWTRDYIKNLDYGDTPIKKGSGGILQEVPDHLLRVGIFGAQNVGKTSIFNLFLHPSDVSIEHSTKGVTSDVKCAEGSMGRMYFTIIDTPAVNDLIMDSHKGIIESIDVALVVTSAYGLTYDCVRVAEWIRSQQVPAILVVNKYDTQFSKPLPLMLPQDVEAIGLGTPVYMSAKEKSGITELQTLLAPYHAMREAERKREEWELEDNVIAGDKQAADELAERRRDDRIIKVAIVGKFNCGKSTLFNGLLGQDRDQVTDVPGTTRDNILVNTRYFGLQVQLIDTPGFEFRKSARWAIRNPATHPNAKKEKITHWMHSRTLMACRDASVILFLIDARLGFTRKEVHNITHLFEIGRPIIIVANKWDEVQNKSEQLKLMEEQLSATGTRHLKHYTIVCCSAKNKTNLGLLMETIVDHYKRWHTRVSSGKLNKFWMKVQGTLKIPVGRSKARHIVQVASSPPTFAVFLSRAIILQGSLANFLMNSIRSEFSLSGIPIRLIQRRKPTTVYAQLGYTPPRKVFGTPASASSKTWQSWEQGATKHNVRTPKRQSQYTNWETTASKGYTGS
eukprot:TRINITY_DN37816_c0_g1_i1.p1 TRINITY_DN37816_c0_g1~~TRINITY_DN37816_c0_g1_i1.p1  ORF type:complete len:611 (+),score=54.78 TRINITY_DN37816_c0_g1_i1:35-1867(+)